MDFDLTSECFIALVNVQAVFFCFLSVSRITLIIFISAPSVLSHKMPNETYRSLDKWNWTFMVS